MALSLSCRRAAARAAVALLPIVATPAFAQTPGAQTPAAPPPAAPSSYSTQQDPQQIRQEVDRLRHEFEAIRDSYGARLAALEAKLGVPPAPVTAAGAAPIAPAPVEAPQANGVDVLTGAPGAGAPPPPLPVYGTASPKVFNPNMAVVGNFLGAAGDNTVERAPALQLHDAEVAFQAVVDPHARADVFLTASPSGVKIEEGFVTFTSLPGGFLAKVGRMKEQFGKVNTMHAHTLPWVDVPIVMKNLLVGEDGLTDSGLSVSKLLPNRLFFLEATGEVYYGDSSVFRTYTRSDVSWIGRLRGYRDLAGGASLDVGASYARGKNDVWPDTSTQLYGVDATVQYRPLDRASAHRFMGRTGAIWSRKWHEDGQVEAFGMYASGEYQLARRWFAGARYDRSGRANYSSEIDTGGSAIVTFWPSEFSQIRGQLRRVNYAEGTTGNEALFQFLFSIGAHGAHVF